jgi:type IV secretory system conjugative DNA transfer VirD4/TraG family protein/helicase HerA-like protein
MQLPLGMEIPLGIVLGTIAARLLRRHELHWSWAAAALVLVALVHPRLTGWGPTALLAAACATLRARRWHREDLSAGLDLADAAALRRSAAAILSAAASVLLERIRGAAGGAGGERPGEMLLGRDEHRRQLRVPIAETGAGMHTLVVGATGSGKTVTQTAIALAAIERGMGVIAVDPKGDADLRDQLARGAAAQGRTFLEWTPQGECVYNPYAGGGDTEIADKALAGEQFTEPHYLRQAQRYLGHAVRVLRASRTEIGLREIVEQLDPDRLELLARELDDTAAAATYAYLDSLTPRQRADLAGVRDRLAVLVESDVGPWLDPQTEGGQRLSLPAAVASRAVVYFRLDSDSRPLLAQMIAAAIVSDLQTTVAGLQGSPIPTLVLIDEFSAVAAEQVVRLFGRARSAGFSLLLGTQEISDLRLPGRERLLEQVMGNLSVLIAHRQVVPASAELIAGVAGSAGAWRVSRHSDGRTTRTRTLRPLLEPTRILNLTPGWAAVLVLGSGAPARIARIRAAPAPVTANAAARDDDAQRRQRR